MADEPRVRRRARLRTKEAAELRDRIAEALGGAKLWDEKAAIETGEFAERALILVDNKVLGMFDGPTPDGKPFLGVRGLLQYRPTMRYVTVDMGAVKFVTNGADVMAPGITEADSALQPGDWCWIRDEKNRQPLAIGQALVPGATMVRGKGKAVKAFHHVGDKWWTLEA